MAARGRRDGGAGRRRHPGGGAGPCPLAPRWALAGYGLPLRTLLAAMAFVLPSLGGPWTRAPWMRRRGSMRRRGRRAAAGTPCSGGDSPVADRNGSCSGRPTDSEPNMADVLPELDSDPNARQSRGGVAVPRAPLVSELAVPVLAVLIIVLTGLLIGLRLHFWVP